jgi:hypothetical protein
MLDPTPASPCPICRRLRALACLSVLGLCASPAGALPPLEPGPAPGPLLAQGEPPGSAQRAQDDRQAPFDALNQVLEDTRAKLEELAEAAATVAADTDLRKELPALERDNERLAAELAQANTCRIELERSSEPAEARIAELTEAVDRARREAAHIDEEIARLRRHNRQLNQSLAHADATRKAAVAEAERTRAEMTRKLEAVMEEVAQSRADLAGLKKSSRRMNGGAERGAGGGRFSTGRLQRQHRGVERAGAEHRGCRSVLWHRIGGRSHGARRRDRRMEHLADGWQAELSRCLARLLGWRPRAARVPRSSGSSIRAAGCSSRNRRRGRPLAPRSFVRRDRKRHFGASRVAPLGEAGFVIWGHRERKPDGRDLHRR